jgi:hypothetical protein
VRVGLCHVACCRLLVLRVLPCLLCISYDNNMKYIAWNLHRATSKFKGGVQKYVLFIHLENYSFFTAPPIKASVETVRTLVNRYPEHMGHCILYQAPTLFLALWKLVTPIIDAHMLSKVIFVQGDISNGSKNDVLLKDIVGDNWKSICAVEGKEYEKRTETPARCPPSLRLTHHPIEGMHSSFCRCPRAQSARSTSIGPLTGARS